MMLMDRSPRVRCHYLAFLSLYCFTASAQNANSDRIVLPANKTEAEITLLMSPEPSKSDSLHLLPLLDSGGTPLSPQPGIAEPVVAANKVRLRLSEIYF